MPDTPFTPAQLALERTGLEFLRNGKFRKARDLFKSLNKSQPTRALPLLIEANLGLAKEMMSKGLVSEANQVFAYLKTIAPADQRLTLTPAAGENPRDAWASMVPLAAQRLASAAEPASDIRAADEMILGATSPDHPGHPDAKAILTALELGYGSADTAQTTPLLRSVPRASPFSHWVFFFKGMTALESGDHARAADCFHRVPEHSLLQPAIAALLSICGASATPQPSPRVVHALCAWAGHPAAAKPLLEAEPLWRKQQCSKAFTLLTNKIPGLFCPGARSFNAGLTRFLTSEFVHTQTSNPAYCNTLLDYRAVKSRIRASAVMDQAFFSISFADYAGCAHRHFRIVLLKLEAISQAIPLEPTMLSRIFTNVADAYISAVKNDPRDGCSGPNAKRALEHAIKHDPNNLRAWLTLCDLLAMGKDSAAYHRFIDDLTIRFPTEKEVLIRNGDCCVGRKVYTKALRNFARAAAIDSVDPRIGRGIVRAQLGIAEEAYKKGKRATVDWDYLDSIASPHKSAGEYPLWRLRVHRISLEARSGMTADQLAPLAAAAQHLSPNTFLLETACRFCFVRYGMKIKEEFFEKMFPSRPAPESLADFLAVVDEAKASDDKAQQATANRLVREIFADHTPRLLRFAAERKDIHTLLIKILSTSDPEINLAFPVIHEWSLRDPDDLLLRFICNSCNIPWLETQFNDDLRDLVTQIRASNDPDSDRIVSLIINAAGASKAAGDGRSHWQENHKLDLDYDPHENDEFDDEDYFDGDDEAYEDEIAAIDQVFGQMSPSELLKTISKILGGAGLPAPGKFTEPFRASPPPGKARPTPKPR